MTENHSTTTSVLTTPAILFPDQPIHPTPLCAFAELAHKADARRLWMGQSLRVETHQALAYLAGAGLRVPVGTSVTLMPLKHPYAAAIEARSLSALTGHPVVAGFGASTPGFVRALTGHPYSSPRTAAHEYLTIVRDVLNDGSAEIHHDGDYHTVTAPPVFPMDDAPGGEVGAGVLRPGMAATAGSVADVAITWMTPPDYLRTTVVPALDAGSLSSGSRPRLATVVHVAVDRPGRDFPRIAETAASGHLRAAHYTDMLRRAGVAAYPDDPASGAAELVRNGVFVTGSPEEIVTELRRYQQVGVDEIILNPAGILFTEGLEAALTDLGEILSAAEGTV